MTEDYIRLAAVGRDSFVYDWIPQRSDSWDSDFHYVTSLKWTNPFGRSGGNQIAWKQSHDLGNMPDYNIQWEDEIACIALLADFSIHACFYCSALPRINFVAHDWADWTKSVEALGSRPLT